jgi:ribosomal protein S18 acetylase RimI-like enzyme
MEMRPLVMDDVPRLTELINRFERHWKLPLISTPALVEDELTEPFIDLDTDSRGLWIDQDLVAYGLISHRPSGERLERAYMFGLVDPDRIGDGLGRQILGWQLERATQSLRTCDPAIPWYARTSEWEWIEPSFRLYRRFGLEPVRYTKEMLMPLDRAGIAPRPAGVDIRSWDRHRDRQAMDVLNRAFADHWGSTPTDFESFQHRLESDGTRVDISFLAIAQDEVVGVCLNAAYPEDEAVTGRKEGWIETLGVNRQWRGRGIATALIGSSLTAFAREGMTHGAIGVDADSQTGAFDLYRRIGFEVTHGTVTSQLVVSPT